MMISCSSPSKNKICTLADDVARHSKAHEHTSLQGSSVPQYLTQNACLDREVVPILHKLQKSIAL